MLILLKLFWTFFKIGLFTIGGGYAMIPLITQESVAAGWATETELMNYLAISESTPGPFAVNCATFIGFSQYGVLGALFATLGVISPSFIIILIIACLHGERQRVTQKVGHGLHLCGGVVVGQDDSVLLSF